MDQDTHVWFHRDREAYFAWSGADYTDTIDQDVWYADGYASGSDFVAVTFIPHVMVY